MKFICICVSVLLIGVTLKITAQDSPVFTLGTVSTTASTVTVPLTADDFSNIVSGNLKILYDPSVTIPVAVTKGPNLTGTFDYNLSDPGIVRIGWFTYPAVTLADGSVIFNIGFTKVSAGKSVISFDDGTISIVDCQFYNGSHQKLNDEPFPTYYIPGSLTFYEHIGPVTTAPALTAKLHENITIPITVTGFDNVGAVSLTLEYDPEVLAFNSADNTGGIPGMIVYNPTPGIITVSGTINDPNGYSLPDGTALFTLNYTYLGGTTNLKWIDEGKTCEYAGPGSAYVFIDTPQSEYYVDGIVVKIPAPEAPVASLTHPACEISTGSVEITTPLGTEYSYSIDGTSYQASPIFSGLSAGTYYITVKNNEGYVSFATTVIIKEQPLTPDAPALNLTHPSCEVSTGTIEVTSPLGLEYSFSIDGTNFQASPMFSDLKAGTYNVTVKYKEECISYATAAVIKEQPLNLDAPAVNFTHPSCEVSTGIIEVTSPLGAGCSYSIDGANYQSSPVFHGLSPGSYDVTVQNDVECNSYITAVVINEQPLFPERPDVELIDPTCDSPGSAFITNYNKTYTYIFIPSGPVAETSSYITGLKTGQSYTVSANSIGSCESAVSQPFTIKNAPNAPEQPVMDIISATCNLSGSASISNYNASYTYNFTPEGPVADDLGNITGSVAGQSYTVRGASINGCVSAVSEPFIIEDVLESPEQPVVEVITATCNLSGSASISNYNVSYTYNFTPEGPVADDRGNIIGSVAGQSYTVTGTTTNGCESTASDPFIIEDVLELPEQPVVELITATCDVPGMASINNYNPAYNYSFIPAGPVAETSGDITSFITGQPYTVTGTTPDGCESIVSEPFTIEDILKAPMPTIAVNISNEFCESECILLIASEGESYLWSTGETTQSIVAKTTGDYMVEVTYENECSALSLPTSIVISNLQQPEVANSQVEIKVYPNPFSDRLRIEFISPESTDACVEIYDIGGRFIKTILNCDIEAGMLYKADFKPQNLTSNVYYYKLTIGSYMCSGKIIYKKE